MYFEKLYIITLLPLFVTVIIFIVWSALKNIYERARIKKLGEKWLKEVEQLQYLKENGDKAESQIAAN